MISPAQNGHADSASLIARRRHVLRFWALAISIFSVITFNALNVNAQEPTQWLPQQRIPDFNPKTDTPILVTDQNRIVHVFSSQWLGEEEGHSVRAIVYNQWSLENGWTSPVDIVLSPLKNDARIMGAFLDQSGIMHVAFFGGDETEANIYYTQAPAIRAGQAPAWSSPVLVGEAANGVSAAALTGDDNNNLVILYSGQRQGWGLYTTYSADGGDTWTDPEPTFLTYDELFPFILKLSPGPSGLIHAVWDVRDLGGNGRQINYANLDLADRQWSEPVTLAEAESGYGVLIPTVVEHRNEVIVAYSGIVIRRSGDGGRTWSAPERPFRQTGINGIMSFVVDSNDDLHLLWAQRITGSPDIHGVWHSMWQNGSWIEPEPVVSGPQVRDLKGDKAFDPYDVRAVVSQGNVLLATWRSDPGLNGNGVWYSARRLDAPELPLVEIPTVPLVTPVQLPTVTATPANPTPVATERPEVKKLVMNEPEGSSPINHPSRAVMLGIIPVILVLSIILIGFFLISQNRH